MTELTRADALLQIAWAEEALAKFEYGRLTQPDRALSARAQREFAWLTSYLEAAELRAAAAETSDRIATP